MLIVLAILQGPIPSRGIAGDTKKSGTKNSAQNTAADQRGTDQLPFVVKTTKTQQEASQEARDRNDKASNDRKLVEFTRQLVVATFVLGAIAVLQFLAFSYQAKKLKDTVDVTAEAVKLAKEEFVATFRPRLSVRHVALTPDMSQLLITYVVTNTGDSASLHRRKQRHLGPQA